MSRHTSSSGMLLGLAIGDALGVPVEFMSRKSIMLKPVQGMVGFGTYHQPPGTWSDDSALAFCLAEALTVDFNLKTIAKNFSDWLQHSYWTARGSVFDVGITTREAIGELIAGMRPELAGGFNEDSNGNGSLMRILPLVIYLKDKPIEERFVCVKNVSSITHAHIRAVIACFYYIEFALLLINGYNKYEAYGILQKVIPQFLTDNLQINRDEINLFGRLLSGEIALLEEKEISSSGYVLHTLEASIWCLLTTNTYAEAVLRAVNLGDDTDTTGCVTGGIAGIIYGMDGIPVEWLGALARKDDIKDLAKRLDAKYL